MSQPTHDKVLSDLQSEPSEEEDYSYIFTLLKMFAVLFPLMLAIMYLIFR